MTMFDFFVEYEAMTQEIEQENRAQEQTQMRIEQMRAKYGR